MTPPVTSGMIEQLAAAMWESLPDSRPWTEASDHWQRTYRDLAATAYAAVRRIDAGQD